MSSLSSLESDPKMTDLHNNDLYYDAMTLLNEVKFWKEGDNGLFITLVPKVLNDVFSFVGFTTLGTYDEF